MKRYATLFLTDRGQRHQRAAQAAAPDELSVTTLRAPDRETLWPYLSRTEYLISERAGVVDEAMIQAAPHLKLIQRLGSLTYDIDTAAAARAGVAVCYWPQRSVILVAEHVVLQMLALARRLVEAQEISLEASPHWAESRRTDEDTFAFNWSGREAIDSLWHKSVGIWGFGEVGVELARRLKGWECDLRYYKRRRLPEAVEAELGIAYASTEELASVSDYLCILLPYHAATDGLIDAHVLAQMRPGAYVVGAGSGSVIDEAALAHAVESGKLAGAALDTFEWEPIQPDNPLLNLARRGYNVVLTPHIAGGTVADTELQLRDDYTNIIKHIGGHLLKYRVA